MVIFQFHCFFFYTCNILTVYEVCLSIHYTRPTHMDNFLVCNNFNSSIPVVFKWLKWRCIKISLQCSPYKSYYQFTVLLIIFVVSSSQSSTQKCGEGTTTGRYTNCSNNIGCPTWYTCNDQGQCMCSNDRNNAVICDTRSFSCCRIGL